MNTAKKLISLSVALVMLLETVGCGYILYPERRGQKSGNIDPAVLIMDGLGLFLWVVPGVVAFAVDFTTGAIYTGGGKKVGAADNVVPFDKNNVKTVEQFSQVIEFATGQHINLSDSNHRIYALQQGQDPALMVAVATTQLNRDL